MNIVRYNYPRVLNNTSLVKSTNFLLYSVYGRQSDVYKYLTNYTCSVILISLWFVFRSQNSFIHQINYFGRGYFIKTLSMNLRTIVDSRYPKISVRSLYPTSQGLPKYPPLTLDLPTSLNLYTPSSTSIPLVRFPYYFRVLVLRCTNPEPPFLSDHLYSCFHHSFLTNNHPVLWTPLGVRSEPDGLITPETFN